MRESLHRYLGIASVLLLGAAMFAACGGLDPRKVSRGPRFEDGGEPSSNAGSPPVSSGGSSAQGGEPGNPFGGQLFTGGAPPVLDGPPEVVEVEPADMTTEVSVDVDVSVLFSEAIDPATVTEDSLQLSNLGTPVSARLSLDEESQLFATVSPTRRLSLAAKYDVDVSTDVTDTTGTPLAAAFASSFTTRDGEWAVTDSKFVDDPATNWYSYGEGFMTIDGRGNTLVAWQQYESVSQTNQIYARWHRATTGWQDAVQVSAAPNSTGYPSIAANESGDAVIVWMQYNSVSSTYEIYGRRYVSGAWSAAPEPIHGDLAMANGPNQNQGPYVKMRGDRVVVWWVYPYYNGSYYYDYLYAQSATVDGAWRTSPQPLEYASSTENIGPSSLAMDPTGNGMLVYVMAGTTSALRFAKYVAGTDSWEQGAPVTGAESIVNNYNARPAVAVDDSGAAMVAWRSSANDLVASRYTKAKGFGTAAPLEELATDVSVSPHNFLASDGRDFFISWGQLVGSTLNAYAAHYSSTGGAWSAAQLVSDGDTGINAAPTLVADPQGNAAALWIQGEPMGPTYDDYSAVQSKVARYLASEAEWATPATVSGGIRYNPYIEPESAVAANGIIAWLVYYAGNYTSEDPHEPLLHVFR
jgi:hypothetical protein